LEFDLARESSCRSADAPGGDGADRGRPWRDNLGEKAATVGDGDFDGRGGLMIVAARQDCKRYFVGAELYLSRRDNQDDTLIVARVGGRPTPRALSIASFLR
jgi:hypothetical protein